MDNIVHNISLGVDCTHKLYFNSTNKSKETHVFEWTGCSMWSINELIQNNFANMLEKYQIIKTKIFDHRDLRVFTHKKYYLRLMHEFDNNIDTIPINKFNEFSKKYERRIKRFTDLLSSDTSILFWRLEEKRENRIIYDEYKEKFVNDELTEIKKFSEYLKKTYPQLKFHVLYFNFSSDLSCDKEHNIIKLPTDKTICLDNCIKTIANIVETNKNFINDCLKID